MSLTRTFAIAAAIAVAVTALAPAAQARHYRHHHARALTVRYIPAHQRPDYVGLAGGGVFLPGLIDVGYGPIFPFSGWPAKL